MEWPRKRANKRKHADSWLLTTRLLSTGRRHWSRHERLAELTAEVHQLGTEATEPARKRLAEAKSDICEKAVVVGDVSTT
jgi:hypothetical protein